MPDIFESVVRADDLFYCQFELVNLTLGNSATGAPQLTRVAAGPAHIVLRLPPQSVAEQVTLTGLPGQSGLSGPSRLTFRVPDGVDAIPYSLDSLLDHLQSYPLETTDPLTGLTTAIEAPDRLLLVPPTTSRFVHRSAPFISPIIGVSELWHSTLQDPASSDGVSLLRPIANPADTIDRPFTTALKKTDRDDILKHIQGGNPNVIAASLLRLTALGATIRLKSNWPPASGITLAAWEHQAELGRDEYVLTVEQGYLFPFGHRASIANITQRTAQSGVAELEQDSVLTILEPERSYNGLAAYPANGREMPFLQVRVVSGSQTVGSDVGLSRAPVKVDLLLTDRAGNHVDCKEASVFFVPAGGATDLGAVSGLYQPLSSLALGGARVVIADNPDGLGDTSLIIDSMTLGVKLPPSDLAAPIVPAFLPYMVAANARIPALEQMVGSSDPTPASSRQPSSIAFHDAYLKSGFSSDNPKGVFAKFGLPIGLAIPPERAGGLAAPKFPGIDGLSRLTGPVAGVESFVNGTGIAPATLVGDTRLLGAILLRDVIVAVTGGADTFPVDAVQGLFNTVDTMTGFLPRPVVTTVPTASGVETRFVWKPQIAPNAVLQANGNMSLVLKGRISAGASSPSSPALWVQGTLSNFALSLLGLVTVKFNSMQFVSQSASKVDVKLDIAGVSFDGQLKFVETLQQLLPTTSLGSLPQVQTLPDGVTVSYAIPVPSVPLGAMNIENLMVSSSVSIPFVEGKPAAVQFALSQRDNPFQINISIFGGTGFFAIGVMTDGTLTIEAALEFGGVAELDLIVVKGGVHLLVGIYVSMGSKTTPDIEGHLRLGGYVDVLGLVGVSIDFYLGLSYDGNVLAGTGRLTVGVKLLFHTESFSFEIHREIAGFGGAMQELMAPGPHFTAMAAAAPAMTSDQWQSYCRAFA